MKHVIPLVCALVLLAGCGRQPREFPYKPITIVVPWAEGGGTDILARALAREAGRTFGVNVNVVNKKGGSGAIGHSYGMKAAPDGYTVTMVTFELCIYKPLGRNEFDDTDFKPVMQINEDPGAITVNATSRWNTIDEFIQYAREHPKEITIGNSGPGAVWHLGAVKLEQIENVRFTHIPHDGASQAVIQLLGNHISAVSVSPAEVLANVQSGDLRCLAIMAEERDPLLPDVPTFLEKGHNLVHHTWRGLAVPKDTPDEVVVKLHDGFFRAFEAEEFQNVAKTATLGLKYRGPEEFKTFLRGETETAAQLIKGLGLQPPRDAGDE